MDKNSEKPRGSSTLSKSDFNGIEKESIFKSITTTTWIILINSAVYLCTSILSGNYLTINESVLSYLSLSADSINSGQVWGFFTSMFTHFSFFHLITNMLFLVAFGLLYESKIGKTNFIIIYLVSGFLGILVLIASTFTGIFCISLDVRRTNMMGCLLLPTIILYLF